MLSGAGLSVERCGVSRYVPQSAGESGHLGCHRGFGLRCRRGAAAVEQCAVELQIISFAFGLFGVLLTYLLARVYRTTPVLMLVLSGVVVAAFFSAMLSAVKYIADPESKLPAITYWLLGSLNAARRGALPWRCRPS